MQSRYHLKRPICLDVARQSWRAAFVLVACVAEVTSVWGADITLVGREKFLATPEAGVRTNARSFYAFDDGDQLISVHTSLSRSDTFDAAYRRYSADNGRTWSAATRIATFEETARGTRRIYPRIGYAVADRDVLIEFEIRGTLPGDDPLEGMKHWALYHRLSRDGGRSAYHEGPVIQAGGQFSASRPFPGVEIGKNSMMIGDQACVPITLDNGELLQPVQITTLGPNGEYHNPGGGYTYHDAAVVIGKWNAQDRLEWTLSSRIVADPARSTRGMLEPTVIQFASGKILMVMRGSNDRRPELPGYKWYSVSEDRGRTWTPPQPWGFSGGQKFYSPSSCSQLLKHSSGRIYWIGNISPTNPRGNLPRHPLVIGEVDPQTMLLIRASLCTIDERRPGESERLLVSNFFAREDRRSSEILVHCSPIHRVDAPRSQDRPAGGKRDWTADAWLYRLEVR